MGAAERSDRRGRRGSLVAGDEEEELVGATSRRRLGRGPLDPEAVRNGHAHHRLDGGAEGSVLQVAPERDHAQGLRQDHVSHGSSPLPAGHAFSRSPALS
jgi:hypothetical protein